MKVIDRDVFDDDLVGKLTLEHGFPEGALESGTFDPGPFDGVKSFKLQFTGT